MHRYSKYLVPCVSGSKLTLIAPDGDFQHTLNPLKILDFSFDNKDLSFPSIQRTHLIVIGP